MFHQRVPVMQLSRVALAAACLIWVSALAAGFVLAMKFQYTGGQRGALSSDWPSNSRIRPERDRYNLVMALHPLCPCSKASISQLAEIAVRGRDRLSIHLLIYRPAAPSPEWSSLADDSGHASIAGAKCVFDEDGLESASLGAKTSGHVFLYDPAGRLVFNGGITPSRGNSGESEGLQAIRAVLSGEQPRIAAAEVYGCPITSP